MTRAKPGLERPVLSLAGDRPLPGRLRLAHLAMTRTPRPVRSQLARLGSRSLARSLPAMLARFPDGRAFRIPANDLMYAQVFVYGAYEPAESRVVAEVLRPGDFAIDVGANHGWFSILMANQVGPDGRVWAVEPVPPMLEELRANLALNPDLPVDVKPLALGTERGEIKLHLFSGLVHGHASTSTLGRDDYTEFSADLCRLDELLADQGSPPAFVKLDVEGGELGVLEGAAGLIASDAPPIWMIEVNHDTASAFGYRPAELVERLRSAAQHRVYRIGDGGTLTLDSATEDAPHGTNWLCVPVARLDRVRSLPGAG